MHVLEILESIKEPYDDEDLGPGIHSVHPYLFHVSLPEDKKTFFLDYLEDGESLETLGDVLLLMLGVHNLLFSYAIDEMIKHSIEPRHLYEYIKSTLVNSSNAKQKKVLKQYDDVPFFIEVTSYLERKKAEINSRE